MPTPAETYSRRPTPGCSLVQCNRCRLAPPGASGGPPAGAVYSEGPSDAKIVFVGEAPGKQELLLGRPFVGGAGKILRGGFRRAGLREEQVWICNLSLCQAPGNAIEQSEIDACHDRLIAELLAVNPDVIVALGDEPLRALTGKSGILKHRGSVYPMIDWPEGHGDPPAVVATVHPSFILRGQWAMLPAMVADLRRARRQLSMKRTIVHPIERLTIANTIDVVRTTLDALRAQDGPVAIDIETVGRRSRTNIVCIGLAWSDADVMVIPLLLQGGIRAFVGEELRAVVGELNRFLASAVPKLFHNGLYDVDVLESMGFTVNGYDWDTLLMHHTVYAELPHKLAFLGSIYTDWPYYKDMTRIADDDDAEGKGSNTMLDLPDEVRHLYNARDALVTRKCYSYLRQELSEVKLDRFYQERVHTMVRPVLDIQRRGMLIDVEALDRFDAEYEQKALDCLVRLREATGQADLNPRSPKQVHQYLFGTLGLKSVARGNSTDEEALVRLTIRYPEFKKLLLDICEYRSLVTIKSTFIDGVRKRIEPDGRLYPRVMLHGTVTGRFATRDPNAQNWPLELREMVVPKNGNMLFGGDAAQLEERLLAYASGAVRKLKAFEDGLDTHALDGEAILGVSRDALTKHSPLRVLIKGFKYGVHYGAGPDKIYIHLLTSDALRDLHVEFTYDDVRRWYATYRELHPEIFRWAEQVYAQAVRDRRVATAYGRVRLLFGPDATLRGQAFNTPIQGSAADYLNDLLVRLWNVDARTWVWGDKGWLFNQDHDALTGEAPTDCVQECAAMLQAAGEQPVTMFGQTFVIPFEVKAGRTWKEV